MQLFLYSFITFTLMLCSPKAEKPIIAQTQKSFTTEVITGAERVAVYQPILAGKKVALVVNQTSIVGNVHLVDTLIKLGIDVQLMFAPEHGIRGIADAGEHVKDDVDSKTGIPIKSLYGKNKKPSKEDLAEIDYVVFDIQDVGVRFYTYISTLHYVMEACVENNKPLLVLDRPNPNAHYVDGPMLESKYTSFVGMHPVPIVYGMTIGEYAQMINGEGWLPNAGKCDLTVINCKNYDHNTFYELPVKPSPNLPNIRSILLYPSICFFEGTVLSLGRGTDKQFQLIGHPRVKNKSFSFTPMPNEGAKTPPLNGEKCYGSDLSLLTTGSLFDQKKIDLSYLLDYYKNMTSSGEKFFLESNFFEKLAGTENLRKQLISGVSEKEIRKTWESGLTKFKETRKKYLLYP